MFEEGPVEDGPYVPDPVHGLSSKSPIYNKQEDSFTPEGIEPIIDEIRSKKQKSPKQNHNEKRRSSLQKDEIFDKHPDFEEPPQEIRDKEKNTKTPKKRLSIDTGTPKMKKQDEQNQEKEKNKDSQQQPQDSQDSQVEIIEIDLEKNKNNKLNPSNSSNNNNNNNIKSNSHSLSSNSPPSPSLDAPKYAITLNNTSVTDLTPHCYVQKGHFRFLITGTPNDDNLLLYMNLYRQYNVSTVVRLCEAVYDVTPLIQSNVLVLEMPFADGEVAPQSVIDDWLHIVDNVFKKKEKECICVHCYTGIGRAPFLVSLALIEGDMEATDALHYLRTKIEGAITDMQSEYVERYRPRQKNKCCVIC